MDAYPAIEIALVLVAMPVFVFIMTGALLFSLGELWPEE